MRSNPWQGFAGLRLCRIPDETTILNFRHFLEHHGLGERLLQRVFDHLQAKGLLLREGSIRPLACWLVSGACASSWTCLGIR